MSYTIPEEYYFRLHHVRPRFKNDVESVLLYFAESVSSLGRLPNRDFAAKLNKSLYKYPGNATKTVKTINNWRTEISALFGFVIADEDVSEAGLRAKELAETGDLVQAFKKFLYTFQYPGAHIKPNENLELIENGISFKPAQAILKIINAAEQTENKRIGLTKGEICHCIFNDLRCTRDNELPDKTWQRIKSNREHDVEYNTKGDIIRYAGDIVDYMEFANLLTSYDHKTYYINNLEKEMVLKFIGSKEWYSAYDKMIDAKSATLDAIKECTKGWLKYVNRDFNETDFATDILAFLSNDTEEYEHMKEKSVEVFSKQLETETSVSAKDIGDMGEGLVYGHECQKLKNGERADLIHLVKRIPTQLAVGYDIQSVELDEQKRYIEVKTTISMKPLTFNKIHLTTNEWSTADTMRDRYFVYRLALNKEERKLFIIQDPVTLYKNDVISMVPREGADITFNPDTAGEFEELLIWKN